MLDSSKPYNLDRIVRLLFSFVVICALIGLVHLSKDVLVPLAAGLLLAYLLDPIVQKVQQFIPQRIMAVVITLLMLSLFLSALAVVVVPLMSNEFKSSVQTLRISVQEGSPLRKRLGRILPPEIHHEITAVLTDDKVQSFVKNNPDLRSAVLAVMKRILPQLWEMVSSAFTLLGILMQLFLVLIYLIFLLIDFRTYQDNWQRYIPATWRASVVTFFDEFNQAMARYFRGQFLIVIIVSILLATGFSIVGIKMAILLGVGIGILNMVPYLQIVGTVPAYFLALMTALETGEGIWWYLIGVTVVFVCVQLIQDIILTPRIMGNVTGLRPVIILFSVFFWGKLLGFLGVLLAIPLTCLGLAYYRRLLAAEEKKVV